MKRFLCIVLCLIVLCVSVFAEFVEEEYEEEMTKAESSESVDSVEEVPFMLLSEPILRSAAPNSYNTKAHNPFISGTGIDGVQYSWVSNRSDIYIEVDSTQLFVTFYAIQPSLVTMYKDGVASGTSFSIKDTTVIYGRTYYYYTYPTVNTSTKSRFSDCVEAASAGSEPGMPVTVPVTTNNSEGYLVTRGDTETQDVRVWTQYTGAPVYAFYITGDPTTVYTMSSPSEGTYNYNIGYSGSSSKIWPNANTLINGQRWYYDSSHQYTENAVVNLLPNFSSLEAAVTALTGNGVSNVVTAFEGSYFTVNFQIPPGNVAYILCDNSAPYSFDFSVEMPILSGMVSDGPWWASGQKYGFSDSLPPTDSQYTPVGVDIFWHKDGKTSVLGQTNQAIFHGTGDNRSAKYLVILNPLVYEFPNVQDITYQNGTINVYCDAAQQLYIYSLKQGFTPTGPSYNNEGEITGTIDVNTGEITWRDPEGNVTTPDIGGANYIPENAADFQSWLKNILNSIVNVFQPAHNAITTLASAVTSFGHWVMALYTWLPTPVLSLLTSAITVAIIIGVIKVFI